MREACCGFCLDFGHANCAAASAGVDPYYTIESLASLRPAMYHLSDNDNLSNEFDTHLNIGEGSLNFQRIKAELSNDAVITLETDRKFVTSLDDFVEDVRIAKEVLCG